MQLDVVLSSLLDHNHVSTILDFESTSDPENKKKHFELVHNLISVLMKNVHFYAVSGDHKLMVSSKVFIL